MKRADHLQGTLELLLLKSLERGPNHGFGIALHVETVTEGLLRLEEGSLYPALHRLEREKLIAGAWRITESGRKARFYSLTARGTKRLEEAESDWNALSKGVKRLLRFA
ncbi:MAG: PadR family transcriptional regulator [Bryobacteraceae bacterium]|jgi:transcriptional regulator